MSEDVVGYAVVEGLGYGSGDGCLGIGIATERDRVADGVLVVGAFEEADDGFRYGVLA